MTFAKELELKKKKMNKQTNKERLAELGYEKSVVFVSPEYDSAIIGVDSNERVVYDFDKMVECLMTNDKMSYDDAVEWIEYNTIRALPYITNSPIVMYPFDADSDGINENLEYHFDPKEQKDRIVEWIRGWFEENGKDCNAVIGLSGGKDSTIAAALCVEALGNDRVIGVALPDMLQGINEADKIAEHLGIKFMTIPIGNACWYLKKAKDASGEVFEWSTQTEQNIPPRIRMAMLYAVSQSFNGRVVGTCNLSENYIGYMTRWGDQASDFEPLAGLTVTEVRAIGHELGLPAEWVDKVPDDGLPKSCPDEEKFGFSYETLDMYIRFKVCDDEAIKAKIDAMHKKNLFKLMPQPVYKPDLWR